MNATIADVEAEQGLLGALLIDNQCDLRVRAHHFHDPVHQRIMGLIEEARGDGRLASADTLRHLLASDEGLAQIGGPRYLGKLAGAALPSQARHLSDIIVDLWARREAVAALNGALAGVADPAGGVRLDDHLARLEGALAAVQGDAARRQPVRMWMDALLAAIEEVSQAYHQEGAVGVRTGLEHLDALTGGLRPGNLCVLAGRPSMGKSGVALAFAVQEARRIAQAGTGEQVVFVTLEMTGEEIAQRFLSMMAAERGLRVEFEALRRGAVSEDEFRRIYDISREFARLPICLIEREAKDAARLRAAVKAAAKRAAPSLIVVDYLQLVDAPGKSTYERVTAATGALKALAGEMAAPVLALSQLSREVEKRDPPRPQMHDLRDSGAIEQDADQVMLVYRPEYYLERMDAEGSDEIEQRAAALERWKGKVEIILPKNRHGRIGTARALLDVATNWLRDEAP